MTLFYKWWAITAIVTTMVVSMASAHDERRLSDWIGNSGIKNGQGEWCCGIGDCLQVEPVRITHDGYYLPVYNETVPYSEAMMVSQDGKYWRCRRPNGTRRCFIAPPPSM